MGKVAIETLLTCWGQQTHILGKELWVKLKIIGLI